MKPALVLLPGMRLVRQFLHARAAFRSRARPVARFVRDAHRAMSELDMREGMGHVAHPVLYLRAGADRLVPDAAGEEVLALGRSAELATVDGPHMPLQAKPAECAARIREFERRIRLAGITGAPAPAIAPRT